MKKILALILAVMLLGTVAFASVVVNPITDGNDPVHNRGNWIPGDTIKFNDSGVTTVDPTVDMKDISTDNYSVTNIKYQEGKKLVESVKINDKEGQIEIKLRQDYSNVKEKNLEMTFTLKGKKNVDDVNIKIVGTVGYALDKDSVIIYDNDHVTVPSVFEKDTLYEVQKNGVKGSGIMEFTTADDDVEVSVRVYEDDRYYLYNEVDPVTDVLKAYADTDADLDFLVFPAAPTFNATVTIRAYKDKDTYVYGIKNGKLVNVDAKWSDDDDAFIMKVRTLDGYVFSNKKLNVAAIDNDTTGVANPDTGANDIVGIAAALAIVALVSAAAVALNKE